MQSQGSTTAAVYRLDCVIALASAPDLEDVEHPRTGQVQFAVMTDKVSPHTSYLYVRPRALHGIARAFDFSGSTYNRYNFVSSPEGDIAAVLQDWLAFGEDARSVVSRALEK